MFAFVSNLMALHIGLMVSKYKDFDIKPRIILMTVKLIYIGKKAFVLCDRMVFN